MLDIESPTEKWKILTKLASEKYLAAIDINVALELLKTPSEENEGQAALICHLSLLARGGNLCVTIDSDTITPSPSQCMSENRYRGTMDEAAETEAELFLQLERMICKAAPELQANLVTLVDKDEIEGGYKNVQTPLCKMGTRYYFQRYWYYESFFLFNYRRFIKIPPTIALDKGLITELLNENDSAKLLLKEQRDAILNASDNTLTIICGGPGTGKTHTAGILIYTLWQTLPLEQKKKFEIALAAPTGKAASNLQKSLLKAAKGVDQLATLQSKTLHSLLGIKSSKDLYVQTFLTADLVIIDESSMVDIRLMGALFSAMKPGARLILLGDGHQLPSIDAGSIFKDFVDANALNSSSINVTSLKTCLRAELQGIIDLASAINESDINRVKELFHNEKGSGITRLKLDEEREVKELTTFAFKHYNLNQLGELPPESYLDHFNKFRILTPLRKGAYGVEAFNLIMSNEYIKSAFKGNTTTQLIMPIILMKNDYKKKLFNGEVGVLVRNRSSGNTDLDITVGDYALFPCENNGIRKIPALLIPTFEYAYSLSVHKSQGSEFDHVLLLMPNGAECFGRELFYTGVTRARKQLSLFGSDDTLAMCISSNSTRHSGIIPRLLHNYNSSAFAKKL